MCHCSGIFDQAIPSTLKHSFCCLNYDIKQWCHFPKLWACCAIQRKTTVYNTLTASNNNTLVYYCGHTVSMTIISRPQHKPNSSTFYTDLGHY